MYDIKYKKSSKFYKKYTKIDYCIEKKGLP